MVLSLPDSWSNWNLEMWVFEETGKPEYPEKTSRSKGENQQETQPTYGVDAAIGAQATSAGADRVLSPLCHLAPCLKLLPGIWLLS